MSVYKNNGKWDCQFYYVDFTGERKKKHKRGFDSKKEALEYIRRIAEVGKLFVDTGIVVLACFVSPTKKIRKTAHDIVGENDFIEVYVSTPLEECERRDVKGLYAKARKGEVKNFTGVSAPFEAPDYPSLSLDTTAQ